MTDVRILLQALTGCMLLVLWQGCNKGDALPPTSQQQALWERGNNFYTQQTWDSAAHCYERLIKASSNSDAAIFYNLGNAQYHLGHTGAAVLAYERALLRKPDYKTASENLELAESRIPGRLQPPEEVFFTRWWSAVTDVKYAGMWAITALLAFIAALAMLYRKRISRKAVAPQLVVAAFLLWGLCLSLAITSAQKNQAQAAVVIHSKAILRTDDNKNALNLPEGTVVKVKATRGSSRQVILADGRSGWLAQDDIASVD